MLVVGEGRIPVNVGPGSGYPGSNTAASGAGGSAGGAGVTGALVPIHHHAARSEWPQQASGAVRSVLLQVSILIINTINNSTSYVIICRSYCP